MDLEQAGLAAQQVRLQRTLVGAGGDHDIVGRDRALRRFGDKAFAVARQPRHRDAAANRRIDKGSIGLDEFDDLARAGERIGVVMWKGKVGQPHRPVGKLEAQAIPAFAAPALGDAVAFEPRDAQGRAASADGSWQARPARRRSRACRRVQLAWRAPFRRPVGSDAARMIQRRNAAKSRCLGAKTAIDQVPAHALGTLSGERRDQRQALQAAIDGLGSPMGIRPISTTISRRALVAPFSLSVPKGMRWYLVYRSFRTEQRDFAAFRRWIMRAASEPTGRRKGARHAN